VNEILSDFIGELRAAGLPVSMTEHVDAARAATMIDLVDRETLRAALSATLVKDHDHRPVFDSAFEVFFARRAAGATASDDPATDEVDPGETTRPPRGGAGAQGQGGRSGRGGSGSMSSVSPEQLQEMLWNAMMNGSPDDLREVAQHAVELYADIEPGRRVGGTYYLYRTLRNLDVEGLRQKLTAASAGSTPDAAWAQRAAQVDVEVKVRELQAAIEKEIRERLVADRGAQSLAKSVRKPLPEDIDVMHATRDEMLQLEKALRPLARKLATRLARRRRRRRRGPVDLRHTVRRSLSTGGVPIDLRFKPPHPAKPEIIVIADISGSVASFARFTLHMVYAIASQFSKVRSFVFIDGLDEVTRLFDESDDPGEAVARINAEADVIAFDGHSDYGRALTDFVKRFGRDINRRSVVIILGDARNNYHQAHPETVRFLKEKARAVYWLNPEPTTYWNSGDSVIAQYAPYLTKIVECRSLRQLEAFVGDLA
jgi:uncharacterized protein with von Willebrand factor type A (vWA) domain